jgi:hypothetical protein
MKTKIESLTKVNDVEIQIVETGNGYFIPIRPICDALEINFSGQSQRVERDEILGSVVCVIHTTGSDKKEYDMLCLPVKFIHGWLFSIDTSRINENARENVIKYKRECYDVLYNHFFGQMERRKNSIIESAKRRVMIEQLEKELAGDERFKKLERLKKEDKQLARERFLDNNRQLNLFKDLFARQEEKNNPE